MGIDLAANGVTPNDAGDQDGIQNYPVLAPAVFANASVRVTGSLNSLANTSFRVELFGNETADPFRLRAGTVLLRFTNVATDGNGSASFDVTVPMPATVRGVSSATGPAGTSEFSAAISPKLLNISTRANVNTGDNVTIGGFIAGSSNRPIRVVVRAIGPSLASAGISHPLPDPLLQLHNANGAEIAANDNWKDAQEAELRSLNLAPTEDAESPFPSPFSRALKPPSPGARTKALAFP